MSGPVVLESPTTSDPPLALRKTLFDVFSFAKKPVTEIIETSAKTYESYNVGEAAKCWARVLETINKQLPDLSSGAQKFFDSSIERSHAITSRVRQMTDNFKRTTNTHVECADTIEQNTESIREELWRTNVLTSSGGAGESGFAEVVYNFVSMEAGKTKYKYGNDYFFIWHPDTSWHPAFYAKVKDAPLPATYLGKSDCLDRLCTAMKTIRQSIRQQGKDPSGVTFHVLIPSWYNIALMDPLRFPDEVLPLRLVGPKHDGGKPLVSFVLPHPQRTLALQAIGNLFEEEALDPSTVKALGAATMISSVTGGSLAGTVVGNMAIVGLGIASSPLALLITAPLCWGGSFAGFVAGASIRQRMEERWSSKRARVLGSPHKVPPDR